MTEYLYDDIREEILEGLNDLSQRLEQLGLNVSPQEALLDSPPFAYIRYESEVLFSVEAIPTIGVVQLIAFRLGDKEALEQFFSMDDGIRASIESAANVLFRHLF